MRQGTKVMFALCFCLLIVIAYLLWLRREDITTKLSLKCVVPSESPSMETHTHTTTTAPPHTTAQPYMSSDEVLDSFTDAALEELYYRYVENIQVLCKHKVRMGKADDGGWDMCNDEEYRPRQPCIVYSFGINDDFTFDDDISDVYGCLVHSFDPSMFVADHWRSDLVYFHRLGLAEFNGVNDKGWKLNTLNTIMKKLNHTKIEILKMDIEQNEMTSLPNILSNGDLKNVDQLFFEIHVHMDKNEMPNRSLFLQGLRILRGLHEQGFRIFYSHRNHWCAYQSQLSGRSWIGCHEVFMVNINPDRGQKVKGQAVDTKLKRLQKRVRRE